MTSKFRLNSAGMAELLVSAGLAADMMARAERVAESVRGSAPVATGTYRASIRTQAVVTDRAVARVVADVPYAPAVEADTGTLLRALDAAG
ncbi:MAG: hypothetical protein ACRC0L_01330 [Angustibacter sp.]